MTSSGYTGLSMLHDYIKILLHDYIRILLSHDYSGCYWYCVAWLHPPSVCGSLSRPRIVHQSSGFCRKCGTSQTGPACTSTNCTWYLVLLLVGSCVCCSQITLPLAPIIHQAAGKRCWHHTGTSCSQEAGTFTTTLPSTWSDGVPHINVIGT